MNSDVVNIQLTCALVCGTRCLICKATAVRIRFGLCCLVGAVILMANDSYGKTSEGAEHSRKNVTKLKYAKICIEQMN